MARKIILDCDPGHDDAMAILLAAVRAPLVRPLVTAADVHGESGLNGPKFPEPTVGTAEEHAVDFIVRTVMESAGDMTLVPAGPLTNIAMALRREPRIAEKVQEVVLMGGSTARGNHTPAAEFNIAVDPEAAAAVFSAPWPVTMVGLNLTHQAGATPEVVERIRSLGTPLAQTVVELMAFFRSTYRVAEGRPDPPVHDACAVARVARPELVQVEQAFVVVETKGEWTDGMTVTDFYGRLGRPPNAQVATVLDREGFWDAMVGAIAASGPRAAVAR